MASRLSLIIFIAVKTKFVAAQMPIIAVKTNVGLLTVVPTFRSPDFVRRRMLYCFRGIHLQARIRAAGVARMSEATSGFGGVPLPRMSLYSCGATSSLRQWRKQKWKFRRAPGPEFPHQLIGVAMPFRLFMLG